jgi:ATP-dependent DNA helicase RecQ
MDTIRKILRKYWGYDGFLSLQEEAIECVLGGRDSVVILPTGGGKSICFQAPAIALPGIAVVISPLISLMKDQVDALTTSGIPAAYLNSSQSSSERSGVLRRIEAQEIKLLYVAPERLVSDGFIDLLRRMTRIAFVAVDEAHCISMWGHDFRPEYRGLQVLKQAFPGVAVHAYTATATEHVRGDIVDSLRLKNPSILVGSFDRANLVYRITRRTNLVKQVSEVLERHKAESGIIYCIRRADVDNLYSKLLELGYRVLPYHAGMSDEERKRSQDAFIAERVDTIIATVAFGMGIDKSNVRYVVHTGMPKSLEHYQQETGRAGRDSLEAECCMFYSGGDFRVWQTIITDSEPLSAEIGMTKLRAIYDFCSGVVCRHKAIVEYFGQTSDGEGCGACDVCLGELNELDDSLITAQKILSCVVRLRERFGGDYTAMVLLGSNERRIMENGHNNLSTYGLLKEHSKRVVRDWIEQLVDQECLIKSGDYKVLTVTPKGWQVLRGELTPYLLKPLEKKYVKESKVSKDSWESVDRGLFEHLRALRREIADKRRVPAYIVFADAALRDMARRKPTTIQAFMKVSGVGQKKSEDFGSQFITAISEYLLEHSPNAQSGKRPANAKGSREKRYPSV